MSCSLAYLTRLYLQVIDSFLVAVPSTEMLRQLFFLTRDWGHGMLAQIVIMVLVLGLLLYWGGARDCQLLGVIALTAPMAAVSVPLTGHAVAHAGSIAVAAQATHVFAAGGWLGTLSVLWLIGRRVPSTVSLASIVRAFSPRGADKCRLSSVLRRRRHLLPACGRTLTSC